ncbi:MazG nucleotide pyrophosphohydrolase domain-containing protein [Pantoea sp. AS142]|uniref:MazG nucleotide pyrophosphohydrolase domain-containing protein n=1 Tax=Pantoea sp. AS142 TaxID=3081292 RepID=UPI00301605DF
MITYDEYQKKVAETDILTSKSSGFIALGLVGEVGDLLSLIKKEQRDLFVIGSLEDHLHEELGDVLWYVTCLINREGYDIREIVRNSFIIIKDEYSQLNPLSLKSLNELDILSASHKLDLNVLESSLDVATALSLLLTLYSGKQVEKHQDKSKVISIFLSKLIIFSLSKKLCISKAIICNLKKIESRWPQKEVYPEPFDKSHEEYERFPDKINFIFKEIDLGEKKFVIQQCQGVNIGDRLTDNKKDKDDYRFHDVFHICFAVHLGWSPVLRALLRLKRKNISSTDENQDGARAIIIEEGVSTFVFSRALNQSLFENVERLDYDLLKFIQEFVKGYEVEKCNLWQWEKAIIDGYKIFRQMKKSRKGKVVADFVSHTVIFEEI